MQIDRGPVHSKLHRFVGIAVLLQAEIGSEVVSFEMEPTYEPLGSPLLKGFLAPKGRCGASASTPSNALLFDNEQTNETYWEVI